MEYRFAPALATQPEPLVRNWGSNNLSVTNVSANDSTPIRIQAIGPGMPGTTPLPLPQNTPVALGPGAAAQGPTGTRAMQLVVRAPNGVFSCRFLCFRDPAKDQTSHRVGRVDRVFWCRFPGCHHGELD